MSSESNGNKPESGHPPPSGTSHRVSGRAPSAWGPARDALAALHNLEALLRSTSVRYPVIRDLVPELRTSTAVLRDAFDRACVSSDTAAVEVGHHGLRGIRDLADLLDATATGDLERDDLSVSARSLAEDLEASADLLALLDRSAELVPTAVGLRLVLRETGRLWGGARGRELTVHFAEEPEELVLDADPYVLGPLLSLVLALVRAAGAGDVLVRARGEAGEVVVHVEAVEGGGSALAPVPVRILSPIPPTEQVARHVAARVGATLELAEARATLRLRRAQA